MPFNNLEENQDEAQQPPRRFGYPFAGDEDDAAINPGIALQPEIAPTFMPQRPSAEQPSKLQQRASAARQQ